MSGSLSCSICSENYKNTDAIYSTSCGHVYHLCCMQQWQSRSTSCPQCRTHNPTSHRIYLTFEDTDEQEKSLALRAQLDVSVVEMSELQLKLDESERSFLALHGQYVEGEDKIRKLNETIRYLEMQNESRVKTTVDVKKEYEDLKQKLQTYLKPEQELVLRDEITSLKLSLHKTSLQLEKEVDSAAVLANRVAVLSDTITEHERCLAVTKEQLGKVSQQLEQEEQRSTQLVQEEAKLKENLQRQDDAVQQYLTVERALQVKIEFVINSAIEGKEREIETLKDKVNQLSAVACSTGGEGGQITAIDADRLGRLQCELKELNALLLKEKKASSDWLMNKIELEQRLERSEKKTADVEQSSRRTEEMLRMKIDELKTDCERQAKALKERDVERQRLLEKIDKMVSVETEDLLRERIKKLNSNLDEAWNEVDVKMKWSKSLAEEKLQVETAFRELQLQHEDILRELRTKTNVLHMQKELLGSQTAGKQDQFFSMTQNAGFGPASSEKGKMLSFPIPDFRLNDDRLRYGSMGSVSDSSSFLSENLLDKNENRSVSIRGIPRCYINGSPEELVLKIAIMLGLSCITADIEKVSFLPCTFQQHARGQPNDNRANVVVKFTRLSTKIAFLSNKQKLKPHGISLNEYVDKDTYRLYKCAARSLIDFDYHVYLRNNAVYFKKTGTSAATRITKKEEIDLIIEAAMRDKLKTKEKTGKQTAKKSTIRTQEAEICNDQFYALD